VEHGAALAKLTSLRDGYFLYFQFYGNMAVAVASLVLAYWKRLDYTLISLGAGAFIGLAWSSRDSLKGYLDGCET
jgi:hypothetical protein